MKIPLYLLIGIAIMLITLSCVEGPKDQVVTKITLERNLSDWLGGTSRVTIFNDGTVQYIGGRLRPLVAVPKTTKIDPDEFKKLVEKAEEIKFFDLKDEYYFKEGQNGLVITHSPTRITTVHRGDCAKRVLNYFGGPEELIEFEDLIAQVVRTRK